MKCKSLRKLTKDECDSLSIVMGYGPGSLDEYIGRYTHIILKSPKTLTSITGRKYHNGKKANP